MITFYLGLLYCVDQLLFLGSMSKMENFLDQSLYSDYVQDIRKLIRKGLNEVGLGELVS